MIDSPMNRRTALEILSASMMASLLQGRLADAAPGRILPDNQRPDDHRLAPLKDLNGDFTWHPSPNLDAWKKRAEDVRHQTLVACGLWPMPARPEIHATIHGKIEREDYTIEKVSFESHAGLYVTGNLYRPKNVTGPRPTILCPHGHSPTGRFQDHGPAKVQQEVAIGAEKFEVGGRYIYQSRCVHLARMGCNAFVYDMLGYADNKTLSFPLIHQFAKQRPELSQPDHWGLFSAQSELRLLNALGLQTWNSIRVIDWLETLPDVDASRIGVTGESGGGTQTFMVGLVDPRPIAFFPAVMVSIAMQGGCTCENATYLRRRTGNIEFAAMLAPRTVGLSGANDWTREIETKGYPELKQHFEMLGVPDKLTVKYFPYEHNFNHPSRALMYSVMQKGLQLGNVDLVERDYTPITQEGASVWDASHPEPPTGPEAEWKVLSGFAKEFDEQLAALAPKDQSSLDEYRRVVGIGWDVLLGRRFNEVGTVIWQDRETIPGDGYRLVTGLTRNTTHHEELPTWLFLPPEWNQQVVLFLTDKGKQGLLDAAGQPIPSVKTLLAKGFAVVGADLMDQGEFLSADHPDAAQIRVVGNPREFLGYTLGYNDSLFAQRVHDILTLVAGAQAHPSSPSAIHVLATGAAAPWAAAAGVVAGKAITKLAVEIGGFRFRSITEIRDPQLVPGALRYGDISGLLALRAPHPLRVTAPDRDGFSVTQAAYAASGQPGQMSVTSSLDDLTTWISA